MVGSTDCIPVICMGYTQGDKISYLLQEPLTVQYHLVPVLGLRIHDSHVIDRKVKPDTHLSRHSSVQVNIRFRLICRECVICYGVVVGIQLTHWKLIKKKLSLILVVLKLHWEKKTAKNGSYHTKRSRMLPWHCFQFFNVSLHNP